MTAIETPPILDQILDQLNGRPDLELGSPFVASTHHLLILIGPHTLGSGFCWCQPRMILCQDKGIPHAHPVHADRIN